MYHNAASTPASAKATTKALTRRSNSMETNAINAKELYIQQLFLVLLLADVLFLNDLSLQILL